MIKRVLKHAALAAFYGLSLGSMVNASEAVSIGRYLQVDIKPQRDQARLLEQPIQVKFPNNVLTIEDALSFLLQFSGYRLVSPVETSAMTEAVLHQPLPEIDRCFGPMTLTQGLTTLVGNAFYLLIDPVHRLVGFQLKPAYRSLYQYSLPSMIHR